MKIQTYTTDGVVVIKPMGRIIGPASNEFRHVVIDQIKGSTESPNFLFDFADVPRMDSIGIGVLVGLHVSIAQRGGQRGGQIGVINLSKSMENIFVMAKLITMFIRFKDADEAIVNLRE